MLLILHIATYYDGRNNNKYFFFGVCMHIITYIRKLSDGHFSLEIILFLCLLLKACERNILFVDEFETNLYTRFSFKMKKEEVINAFLKIGLL